MHDTGDKDQRVKDLEPLGSGTMAGCGIIVPDPDQRWGFLLNTTRTVPYIKLYN
jgi:hypothetical protein